MKKITILLLLISVFTFSQNAKQEAFKYLDAKGEVFIEFKINDKSVLNILTNKLSIVDFNNDTKRIKARLNRKEFTAFLLNNYEFEVKKEANETGFRKMFNVDDLIKFKSKGTQDFPYNEFPTYNAYINIMNSFETEFPNLCKKIEIGTSVQNRKLLAVKLSNNVNVNEQEPKFLYVSTMHGDETTGYPIMLRLIEYLLDNYGTNQTITNLLDNNAIYISPLHNPDGTYAGGNNTVSGATRGNANYIDLNRNFPDPEDGVHSDGQSYEPETLAYMAFAETNHFVLACNFHGGTEVVNYPWDTFQNPRPDNDYWQYVCREYADQVHTISSLYMNGFDNGITNGWDWYEVRGGRQDYMNYYEHTREITLEISNQKNPSGSQLPTYWNLNKDALINYIKQVENGIKGVVTDADTGLPIKASIYIESKDQLNTWVHSYLPFGDYYRPIKGGNYQVTFVAPCYEPQTITVNVTDDSSTVVDVALMSLAEDPIVSNQTINFGETATLITTTNGTTNWYTNATTTTVLATGNSYTTPNLTTTTSYFVESEVVPAVKQLQSPNIISGGSFYSGINSLVFDCFEPITLHKVKINAEVSGSITVALQESNGTVLQTTTLNVTAGVQDIVLNFDIPEGRDLKLIKSSGINLFRNNSGVNYPYDLQRFISIKRSTSVDSFSYYYNFYNWELQQPTCISNRVEVVVTVNSVSAIEDEFLKGVIMYPNPVEDRLRLSLPETKDNLEVLIFDVLGKQIFNKKFKNETNNITINTSKFISGVYIVRLQLEKSVINKQLIVN